MNSCKQKKGALYSTPFTLNMESIKNETEHQFLG
jgi:hypothetical protein